MPDRRLARAEAIGDLRSGVVVAVAQPQDLAAARRQTLERATEIAPEIGALLLGCAMRCNLLEQADVHGTQQASPPSAPVLEAPVLERGEEPRQRRGDFVTAHEQADDRVLNQILRVFGRDPESMQKPAHVGLDLVEQADDVEPLAPEDWLRHSILR